MKSYQSQQGGCTNERIAKLIYECLQKEVSFEIGALKPEERFMYIDLSLDFVKRLEYPLNARNQPS